MSAWSDWRCGAISDDEYRFLANREGRKDQDEDPADDWEDDDSEGWLIDEN